jgi:hypothetical protein
MSSFKRETLVVLSNGVSYISKAIVVMTFFTIFVLKFILVIIDMTISAGISDIPKLPLS